MPSDKMGLVHQVPDRRSKYSKAPSTEAAASTCTRVASVSNCINAINSRFTRTKTASSFCYSVLGCTSTPTVTLLGTVTSTSTKVIVELYTFEELGSVTSTTETYSYTETTYLPSATTTIRPTYWVEKFVVQTVKAKRDHPREIAPRATTTTPPICASTVQSKACSCLVTCPTTVTKDKRTTIKEKTTETSYFIATSYVDYTEILYDGYSFTVTQYYLDTATELVVPTHTRTVKCTPSVANPSFYLKATNAPDVDNKYIQAYPDPKWGYPTLKSPFFVDFKEAASVFYLDSQSRLLSNGINGTVYGWSDGFNDFQLFYFMERRVIQISPEYGLYAYCTLNPPSGLYAGGHQEMTCETRGFWNTRVFQWCPIYVEFYGLGLVLGSEASPESPDCLNITLLVVPACGG
ncbi:hypothetical protein DL98DRAFT_574887 [Cadophora sp. DSE1049]|nr:hypothetical protein DL98DRAFT_574887 [Cadophora sp. DSE1049]